MSERTGVIYGMRNQDYHSGQEVSNSALSAACRSMKHYQAYRKYGSDIAPKTALDGNIIHCAILEPAEFDLRYVVAPKFDMRTTIGKAGSAEFEALANGRERITLEQYEMAMGAQANVFASDFYKEFMAGTGFPEVSFFWEDSESGLKCRCRPDWWGGSHVVDVKSTEDCRQFQKSVLNYGYHRQESFYRSGMWANKMEVDLFFFLAIEKKPPYDFMVFQLDDELLQVAEGQIRGALNAVALADFTGEYPGYDHSVQVINKPAWIL